MAASENDAAQSTKNIGSASDEPKNKSQSADYEVEEDKNYSEEQNDEQNSEDEEDSVGYASPREAEEETAQTDRTKVTSRYGKGPHGAQKRKGPHGTLSRTKRKAKMPAKSGRNKKRRRSFSSTSSSSESSSSSHSDSSDTDSSSTEEENSTWQMTKSDDLNAWKLPKKLAKTFAKNLNEHFTDEDINANILEENTVAKNIPQIPQLDSIMETYLGNNQMGYVAVNDKAKIIVKNHIKNKKYNRATKQSMEIMSQKEKHLKNKIHSEKNGSINDPNLTSHASSNLPQKENCPCLTGKRQRQGTKMAERKIPQAPPNLKTRALWKQLHESCAT